MTRKGKNLLFFKPKKHGFARGFMAEVTTPRVAVLVGFFRGPLFFHRGINVQLLPATLHKTTILPLKRWGWKTHFLLGNSNFQGRAVSLGGSVAGCSEKLLTDQLIQGVITSTSLRPRQCTSTGTLSWLPPDPKRSRKQYQ